MRGTEFFSKLSKRPPFSKMNPQVAAFFRDHLAHEKVVRFGEQYVLNTHFPPYPSGAFDNMASHFDAIGEVEERRLFSVTLALTNRCNYRCWHCYNSGRSQKDLTREQLGETVSALQSMSVVHVTLTGGEPLLRPDLEEIAADFDDSTYLSLNTTGAGLTAGRARSIYDAGVFALGVSLDSLSPEEHDRGRGRKGAFETAVAALALAADAGLYPYVISVATRSFFAEDHFMRFLRFASDAGAREVHLLEPCATGRLAGRQEVTLTPDEKRLILDYQKSIADDETLPILSSFLYLESAEGFGCGAGLTHLYVDGSGEVCPCNLVPLSFGNITQDALETILERMARHFSEPRCECVGHNLGANLPDKGLPLSLTQSEAICSELLPRDHPIPRFFDVRSRAKAAVGQGELQQAYDEIHASYDAHWLTQAASPIHDLLELLPLEDLETVVECGCGTGYATHLIAPRLPREAVLHAVDISGEMLELARQRLEAERVRSVRFHQQDALALLQSLGSVDLVVSTWVLGYIPLRPFLEAAQASLKEDGLLAFVVHRDNSPQEPLEVFRHLVSQDPSVLLQAVDFDFPESGQRLSELLRASELDVDRLYEGRIVFPCESPRDVLDHLLKSGAGTAYFNAVDPGRRDALTEEFLTLLDERRSVDQPHEVVHEYLGCVARKV